MYAERNALGLCARKSNLINPQIVGLQSLFRKLKMLFSTKICTVHQITTWKINYISKKNCSINQK